MKGYIESVLELLVPFGNVEDCYFEGQGWAHRASWPSLRPHAAPGRRCVAARTMLNLRLRESTFTTGC